MIKRNLLLAALIISVMQLSAQTIVTTLPQYKNAILEEYTGILCGWCPSGHRLGDKLSDANPNRVVLINVHCGSYATPPGATYPDFRTSFGSSLLSEANGNSFPSASVNRRLYDGITTGTTTAMSTGYDMWKDCIGIVLNELSPVNVGFETSYNSSNRELTVDVELYYTINSPASENFLHIALLENHVAGYQKDYEDQNGHDDAYDHTHIFRHFITGQWGESITTTTSGSLVTKSYTYTVPVEYNVSNCDIAAYVSESRSDIYTGDVVSAINGSSDGVTEPYTCILTAPDTIVGKGSIGNTTTFDVQVESFLAGAEDYTLNLTSDAPSNWSSSFMVDGTKYNTTASIAFSKDAAKTISISVIPGSSAAVAKYTINAQSETYPQAAPISKDVYVVSGVENLIVSCTSDFIDGTSGDTYDYKQYFADGLQHAGEDAYGFASEDVFKMASKGGMLSEVKSIFYNAEWRYPVLPDEVVQELMTFIDNGGSMMLSGQNVGWLIKDYGTTLQKQFYFSYVCATYLSYGSSATNQLNVFSYDTSFRSTGNSTLSNAYGTNSQGLPNMTPDIVYPNTYGKKLFYYGNDTLDVAGVRSNDSRPYKTVSLAFSLEMIADEGVRNNIVKLAYNWFNGLMPSTGFDEAMKQLNSASLYPNPTTSNVTINYQSLNSGVLYVHDITGKVVAQQQLYTGNNTFFTDDLDGGVYFYKIVSEDGIVGNGKLVVVKE